MFDNIYHNKNILITGHTGFKGSWLALWLTRLGAQVTGYSLEAPTDPNHFELLGLNINSIIGDIRDSDNLAKVFKAQRPEVVFHLAAQAIVRRSYRKPVETFAANVMGTVNVLEAARTCDSVRAVVIVTSDKCYENREWPWGYREIDALGGYDPYSASKGCSEIVASCWRNSFFNPQKFGQTHQTLLATARAGNVIGGGDWASDRLIPDIMRSISQDKKVIIRNPDATRPWQHVLEPLAGYLLLGEKLLDGRKEFAEAWNFGPSGDEYISVGEIIRLLKKVWPKIDYEIRHNPDQPHEAGILKLDCSKALAKLGWSSIWNTGDTIDTTARWYKEFYESHKLQSQYNIECYTAEAQRRNMTWSED